MTPLMHVVSAEAFKVAKKKRIYVLAALYWVVLPVLALIIGRLLHTNLSDSFANEVGSIDQILQALVSPFGLATVSLMAPSFVSPSLYMVAVVLLAALLIGDEKSQNMWKTVLVVQPNRVAVIAGKMIVAMGALLFLMAGAFVSSLIFGTVGTSFLPTSFQGDWARLAGLYLVQWLFLLAPVALAFLLVFVVRSGVLGVVMVLFLPGLIEGIYTVLNSLLQLQPLNRINAIFQALRIQQAWQDAPRYFFTANLYAPARSPGSDLVAELVSDAGGGAAGGGFQGLEGMLGLGLGLPHSAAVVAGYAVLFGGLLFWAFLRRDID